jgi:hypothetical protein
MDRLKLAESIFEKFADEFKIDTKINKPDDGVEYTEVFLDADQYADCIEEIKNWIDDAHIEGMEDEDDIARHVILNARTNFSQNEDIFDDLDN